jgi:hypothetical protein
MAVRIALGRWHAESVVRPLSHRRGGNRRWRRRLLGPQTVPTPGCEIGPARCTGRLAASQIIPVQPQTLVVSPHCSRAGRLPRLARAARPAPRSPPSRRFPTTRCTSYSPVLPPETSPRALSNRVRRHELRPRRTTRRVPGAALRGEVGAGRAPAPRLPPTTQRRSGSGSRRRARGP